MSLGLANTIKNCSIEQFKIALKSLAFGCFYVIFMILIMDDGEQAFNKTVVEALTYFNFIFIVMAMMYHTNFLRTSAMVMLMLGDTRRNLSVGRHISTALFVAEGAIIACLPMLADRSGVFSLRNVLITVLAVIMASGVGMISGYFAQILGSKFQMITTVVIIVVVAVVAGIFFGLDSWNMNLSKALLIISGIVAVVLYVIGTVLSNIYIRDMEVRV